MMMMMMAREKEEEEVVLVCMGGQEEATRAAGRRKWAKRRRLKFSFVFGARRLAVQCPCSAHAVPMQSNAMQCSAVQCSVRASSNALHARACALGGLPLAQRRSDSLQFNSIQSNPIQFSPAHFSSARPSRVDEWLVFGRAHEAAMWASLRPATLPNRAEQSRGANHEPRLLIHSRQPERQEREREACLAAFSNQSEARKAREGSLQAPRRRGGGPSDARLEFPEWRMQRGRLEIELVARVRRRSGWKVARTFVVASSSAAAQFELRSGRQKWETNA